MRSVGFVWLPGLGSVVCWGCWGLRVRGLRVLRVAESTLMWTAGIFLRCVGLSVCFGDQRPDFVF